jgi:ArsR family transcriptional regulator
VIFLYPEEDLKKIASVFNALSNDVRLKILLMIADTKRPLHIRAVAMNLKMDYGAIYRHIEILQRVKLLEVYDVGRSRVLSPLKFDLVKRFMEMALDACSGK